MSTVLSRISLTNRTGLVLPLTIEAPLGNVVGPNSMPAQGEVGNPINFDPKIVDCSFVRIIVTDPDHGATKDFTTSGNKFIDSVDAYFDVGNISGTISTN